MISEQYVKKSILIFSCTIFGRKKATELLVRITMMGNHSDWVATTLTAAHGEWGTIGHGER
jgi:hypothetical protein